MGVTIRQQIDRFGVAITVIAGLAFGACAGRDAAWWLQWLCLAALGAVLADAGIGRASRLGLAFGFGWFAGSIWWLYISMHVYGGMPAWMAAFGVLAFSLYLALFPAAACALHAVLRSRWPQAGVPGFALAWAGSEWLRGTLFTGFPWNATGHGQVGGPLAALAGVGGVDLVTFATAFIAAALAQAALQRTRGAWLAAAITAAAALAAGLALQRVEWSSAGGMLRVALIQGNIAQEEKFAQERLADHFERHIRMIAAAQGELIVTPETAIPVLPRQLPDDALPSLIAHLRAKGSAALIGIPLERADGEYTNSVIGIDARSADYRYDKHHLVPFGEFIPPGFHWFVRMMNMPLGDFARGAVDQPSFEVRGERVAPTICYEDVFGGELRARFADEAKAPTIIANLTNLAWFGDTIAIDQHLAIARMRSIEFARPSIRATNTGATAVIDHHGTVVQMLPRWTQGTLSAEVQGRRGLTPYARWGNAGWGIAALLIFGMAARRTRRR
jgi:apolipoprotein N-acyltransferase